MSRLGFNLLTKVCRLSLLYSVLDVNRYLSRVLYHNDTAINGVAIKCL